MKYVILYENSDLSGSYTVACEDNVLDPEKAIVIEADSEEAATKKLYNLEFCRSIGLPEEMFCRRFRLREFN